MGKYSDQDPGGAAKLRGAASLFQVPRRPRLVPARQACRELPWSRGGRAQSAISRAGLLLGRAYMERLARGKALRRRGGGGARKKHGTDVGGGGRWDVQKGCSRSWAGGEDPAGCRLSVLVLLGSLLEAARESGNDTGHQVRSVTVKRGCRRHGSSSSSRNRDNETKGRATTAKEGSKQRQQQET